MSGVQGNISIYTILKDLGHRFLAILLLTIAVGLMRRIWLESQYHPVYTTRATMVVTNSGIDSNLYQNLYSASGTTKSFAQLINSSALRKIVAKDIGLENFEGTCTATNIQDSNLMEITVQAQSPEISFKEMKSILKNYRVISQDLLGNIQLTLLEEPVIPDIPSNPLDTSRQVAKAMLMTAALLTILLSFLSAMRDTIRTTADVEQKLEGDLLATVHYEQKYKGLTARIRHMGEKTSILISDPVTSFRYVETIRKLTARILNKMHRRNARVMLITSVLENEGKSTIAANIALAMAQEGHRTILVDADFRKPSQYKILNLQDMEFASLTKVLRSSKDFSAIPDLLCEVPGSRLQCILNKTAAPQSMEMFSSGRVKELISQLRKQADIIIVDSSPMQLVADAEELADLCDCSVLVVRQHLVEAGDINDAGDALNGGANRLLGIVFNNVHSGIMPLAGSSSGYGYGYGYGYEYGSHQEK